MAFVTEQRPSQISVVNWLKGAVPPGKTVNLLQPDKGPSHVTALHYSDGTVVALSTSHHVYLFKRVKRLQEGGLFSYSLESQTRLPPLICPSVPQGLQVEDITVMRRNEEVHIYVVAKGLRRLYFFKVRNSKAEFKSDIPYGFEGVPAPRREEVKRRLIFNTPHKLVVIADGEDIYFRDIDKLMNN